MSIKTVEGQITFLKNRIGKIQFELGGHDFGMEFAIHCPYESDHAPIHEIVKNGHAANTKAKKQQFFCHTCGHYFFIHKCKYIKQFEQEIKAKLCKEIISGKVSGNDLSKLFHWSISSSIRYIDKVLDAIAQRIPYYQQQMGKIHAKILYMDETFLKIGNKTWYLIMAITETGQILSAELRKHRDQDALIEMVRYCEAQLDSRLEIFVTDGLSTYKGIALTFGHDLIHIRHIHQPPYGRVEIDVIVQSNIPGIAKRTTLATTNDIFQTGGCFLVTIEEKTIKYLTAPVQKRGRKAGGKNRPKLEINEEKSRKKNCPKKRGRPKKNPHPTPHVFYLNKEKGCIQAWGGSSEDAANVLNTLHHFFGQKCITTNLIEKEFSVLKILICFRGRRSLERWNRLIHAYCWIRNDPFILSEILAQIPLSGHAIQSALTTNLTFSISN